MEFEIFKTGTHTSDKGVTKTYTQDDLNFIASSYLPSEHEAPIVIGHPVDNSPAFGWIESLKVVGDKLMAKAKDVVPEFKEALQKKLYKKRSVSLDADGKLRHVGFLGGAAPAVKGLADIKFSDSPSSVTFEQDLNLNEFSEISELNDKSKEEKNEKIEDPGIAKNSSLDDPAFTSSVISKLDSLKNQLSEIENSISDVSSFSDSFKPDIITNIKSQIDDLSYKFNYSEFEDKLNDKVVNQGTLTPAMKSKILDIISFINSQNFTSEFSANEFNSKIKTLFENFINSIPRIIYYENFAEKPDEDIIEDKADYSGLPVDEEASALHKKALFLMKKNDISYLSAINKLTMNN